MVSYDQYIFESRKTFGSIEVRKQATRDLDAAYSRMGEGIDLGFNVLAHMGSSAPFVRSEHFLEGVVVINQADQFGTKTNIAAQSDNSTLTEIVEAYKTHYGKEPVKL